MARYEEAIAQEIKEQAEIYRTKVKGNKLIIGSEEYLLEGVLVDSRQYLRVVFVSPTVYESGSTHYKLRCKPSQAEGYGKLEPMTDADYKKLEELFV